MTWHNETNSPAKRVARIVVELLGVLLFIGTVGYTCYTWPLGVVVFVGATCWMVFLGWILEDDREEDREP